MFNIGNNFIISESRWTGFKTITQSKGLSMQYLDDGVVYDIISIDGVIVYRTNIWKGTMPSTDPNYSQSQNDTDKTDFENNFKNFINKSLTPNSNIISGYNTSSGSSLTVIRATSYTEQITNAQRSIASNNVNDTSAGTGARTVKITYYDQTLSGPLTETITLNGTTAVNTVASDICFIDKIEVMTVGNQLSNIGTITLYIGINAGGGTIGTVAAGDGVTNWCHHYVGLNKIMKLVSVIGSIKGQNNGSLEVHRTVPTSSIIPELTVAPKIRISADTSDRLVFDVPIIITGPALVLIYGRSDSATGNLDWSVGMGYYEA